MDGAQPRSIYALVTILVALTPVSFANFAFADSGHREYNWLVGVDFLCTLGIPNACPDIAMATNGDSVSVAGTGTLTIHPNSVTGSGTFTHKDASGNVKAVGTWTATKLLSFVSYGSAGPAFPPGVEGGKAVMLVHLSAGFDAILTVICDLGSAPTGQHEGIHLNVQDVINFNKQVSGLTVFVRTA